MNTSTFPMSAGAPAEPSPHGGAGLHVAIIMDGNGRWATERGRPRAEGHRAGSHAVRKVVTAAPGLGISTLTLYAFSSDNWRRPRLEVRQLMRLLQSHLRTEARRCVAEGVRVSVIGRRDRLEPGFVSTIESVEDLTRDGSRLLLHLAIDYSGRETMLEALRLSLRTADVLPLHGPRRSAGDLSRKDLSELMGRALHAHQPLPEVDLLIRTGGEKRLSDFLLWEAAYAELLFTPCPWPDFSGEELAAAVEEFRGRERRFGGVSAAAVQEVSHG